MNKKNDLKGWCVSEIGGVIVVVEFPETNENPQVTGS